MSQNALSLLRTMLEEGDYTEGDKLPSERALVEKLGVSRRALRQAFGILEAEGQLWRGVGQGTFVGPRKLLSAQDVLAVSRLTSPDEVMHVRLVLEPPLAKMASLRANGEDLGNIRHCLDRGSASPSYETYDQWDERFHKAIAEAAHHRLFLSLFLTINRLRAKTSWGSLRKPVMTKERFRTSIDQHRSIYKAICDRDAKNAERLMAEHLRSVYQLLFGTSSGL